MRGQFIITAPGFDEFVLPNTITAEGAEVFLGAIFQATVPVGFYVGLCDQVPDNADVLADIITEPTIAVNGYARVNLAQNGTDWPVIDTQNGESYVESKQCDFTASGGAFDDDHTRLFICSVATGFVGTLYSYSAALASALTVADGVTWSAKYQMFLN